MERIKLKPEKEDSVHFVRHSKADYKTYKEVLKSESPQQTVDYDKQITPDLSKIGVELAKQEAEKFFTKFNFETDALFFVSSEEIRALETANIYRQVAKEKGFEIITPGHVRSKTAEEIGECEIRKLDTLSIDINNILANAVFNPEEYLGKINFNALNKETKEKWEKAREIINSNDKGSWGANFYFHSEAIQKIFPEIKSAKQLYNSQFKNIIRLIKFADKKTKAADYPKNIKVLGFGHENYLGYALNKYFNNHELGNCEAIDFKVDEDRVIAGFKANEKEIDN